MKRQKLPVYLLFSVFVALFSLLFAKPVHAEDLLDSLGISSLFESEETVAETTTVSNEPNSSEATISTTQQTISKHFSYDVLADLVTVHKKKRELQLWSNGKLLKAYKIALGFNPVGHKRQEGDGKTPEGIYLLTDHNENSNYYRSILVDYPSGADLVYAEKNKLNPGGAIMIHGLPNDGREVNHPKKDWTDGCIAVTNQEMREIWNAVPPNTPIMIEP